MKRNHGMIIILGAPNDDGGNLSAMAQGRVALGYAHYCERGWPLLLTGGIGDHFNRTTLPHAYYLQQWLLAHGVPPHAILPFVRSRHTGEDALLARPIVETTGARQLLVVTSDFHVERAAWHFRAVFPDDELDVVGAPYLPSCTAVERARLVAHEARRLAELQERTIGKP
ncbi:MAG TPA: YdcF family protein [Caldilineaceae bacterium]|nr:YdcF family protein [Caldilineaceae bacterium]